MLVKLKEIFKDKFSRYALIQMLIAIILFGILIILAIPEVIRNIKYLNDLRLDKESTINGFQLVYHSRPLFYLAMFSGSIAYTIYGIKTLIKFQNQRQVFKIIFRSIFYVSGMILFHYVITLIAFLVLPVTDIMGIFALIYFLFVLEVAIGGRFVSNFTLVNMTLRKRKLAAYITLGFFAFFVLANFVLSFIDTFELANSIFYFFESISVVFAIFATYYFKDPINLAFELEPDEEVIDDGKIINIDETLEVLPERIYNKDIKITNANLNPQIKVIPKACFANALKLKTLTLPKSIEIIEANAFFNCLSLKEINYLGTMSEFHKIIVKSNAFTNVSTNKINCSDGRIYL